MRVRSNSESVTSWAEGRVISTSDSAQQYSSNSRYVLRLLLGLRNWVFHGDVNLKRTQEVIQAEDAHTAQLLSDNCIRDIDQDLELLNDNLAARYRSYSSVGTTV